MNREIKFKGQTTTGQWVFGLPHSDLPNETFYYKECSQRICWHPETGGSSNAPIKNGTLCQFTGMLNKNGVEIYEDDIVMCIAEEKYKEDEGIGRIAFSNNFQWSVQKVDDDGILDDEYKHGLPINFGGFESLEVIGNVHTDRSVIESVAQHSI